MSNFVMCKNGLHSLVEVYVCEKYDYDEVVRWCQQCGAIVVDMEDGCHVRAGGRMEMKLPEITKIAKKTNNASS